MMFTVMNEATFLCVSAVGGRRSGWMGGYKMQDSDSRDPGSHPESCVCSGLVQVSEICCCGLNVHKHVETFFCIKQRPGSFSDLNQVLPESEHKHKHFHAAAVSTSRDFTATSDN